ncbi:MAG: autotransporter outer membrane beta-barrel domain-containing protein, partial [Proteobacteria bacterium]|nr:autotransporter outer membrane beta-barrel domain-containing protein [Pseudomonadota bacterium]
FTVSNISSHIAGALSGRGIFGGQRFDDNRFEIEGDTGLNAGDGSSISYGVWGNYSYTDFDNDLSSIAFDGSTHSFLGGIDFSFWENTVMGVAFGYDNSDIDTTFNQGHQDTDTFTIAPYFGALISDNFSLDFNIGYSNVDYDQFRTIPGTTTRVTSSPDSDRWFGAFNLNGVTYYDNWILGARIGALWAENELDSFTESNGTVVAKSNTKVSTGSVAGDVAYSYQNFEPFLNLAYQYDFSLTEIAVTTGPQPSNDNDDILMRVGVRYFDNNGISGNLEYSKRFERDDFDEDRISLTVRVDF